MDLIEKYRNFCLFYIKLDIGFLVGFISIAGLFKFENADLVDVFDSIEFLVFIVAFFIFFGLLFDFFLLAKSKQSETEISQQSQKAIRLFSELQFIFHTIFIFFVCINLNSAKNNYFNKRDHNNLVTAVKGSLIRYLDKYGNIPNAFEESTKEFPLYIAGGPPINGYQYKYEKLDSNTVYFLFPGEDNLYGTKDDWGQKIFVMH